MRLEQWLVSFGDGKAERAEMVGWGGRLQCRLPGETDIRPPQSLRSRDSAALATSPMRTRNSVPISAL